MNCFNVGEFSLILPKKQNPTTGVVEPLFEYVGIDMNEHCWAMQIGAGKIRILVRSSISARTGVADGVGQNSIRLVVQRRVGNHWQSVSKGPDAYTQRIEGWENRLFDKIKKVYHDWKGVKQDFSDEEKIFVSKQPGTKGRVFSKNSRTGEFRWLN